MRVARHFSFIEQKKSSYKYWCKKVKRFPGTPGDRWEDNIILYIL
jgi:hypothetical protein